MSNGNWIESFRNVAVFMAVILLSQQMILAVTACFHRHTRSEALNQLFRQAYKAFAVAVVATISATLWQYVGRETDLWFIILLGTLVEGFGGYLFYKVYRKAIAEGDSPAVVVALYLSFVAVISLIAGYFVSLGAVFTGKGADIMLVLACAICTGAITIILGAAVNWYVSDSLSPMLKSWSEKEEAAGVLADIEEKEDRKAGALAQKEAESQAKKLAKKLELEQEAEDVIERQRQAELRAQETKTVNAEKLRLKKARELESRRQPVLQAVMLRLASDARLGSSKKATLEKDLRILLERFSVNELKQFDTTVEKLRLDYENIRFSPTVVMDDVTFNNVISCANEQVRNGHSNWPEGWVEQIRPQMEKLAEGVRSKLTPEVTPAILQRQLVDLYYRIDGELSESRILNGATGGLTQ